MASKVKPNRNRHVGIYDFNSPAMFCLCNVEHSKGVIRFPLKNSEVVGRGGKHACIVIGPLNLRCRVEETRENLESNEVVSLFARCVSR